jgi:hypothetical protein
MPKSITTISGILEQVDYSNYEFVVDPFDAKNLKLTDTKDLDKSVHEQAFWRLAVGDKLLNMVKWTTPKRTRSYPLSRTYSLLSSKNPKIALIPIIKDEGEASRNPDVLGIDTIFLLTLFNVYCVLSYYNQAEKKTRISSKGYSVDAITNQRINFRLAQDKIKQICKNNISVDGWNAKEVRNYSSTLKAAGESYEKIQRQTGVKLPTVDRVKRNSQLFVREGGLDYFVKRADERRLRSQQSESLTLQPKERVLYSGKAKVDILLDCDLGIDRAVMIHWAPDEHWVVSKNIFCVEKKHNPSRADLTDALFKNFAFRNMKHLNVANPTHFPIGLTSDTISGTCFSLCDYFGYCKQSNWTKCQNKLLSQYNKTANFRLDTDLRNILMEGHLNKFPVFVIGTRSINTQTIGEIQTSIIKQISIR